MTHETVMEVDVSTDAPVITVTQEPSVRVVQPAPDIQPAPEPKVLYEWQSERSIEGRKYHRLDGLVPVETPAGDF